MQKMCQKISAGAPVRRSGTRWRGQCFLISNVRRGLGNTVMCRSANTSSLRSLARSTLSTQMDANTAAVAVWLAISTI
jgi:hypothetical protein